ncbi:MAG: M56 family metallopeptidase [Planctomycetota bacterium]|jgi:beta-lactamase regulating signal transducer with metallopeptidase domain
MLALFDGAYLFRFAAGCLTWLVDSSVKATVVLTIASVVTVMLRRNDARVRQVVWTAALLGVLVTAILSLTAPAWRLAILPAPPIPLGGGTPSLPVAAESGISRIPIGHEEMFPDYREPSNARAQPPQETQDVMRRRASWSGPGDMWRTPLAWLPLGLWLSGVVVVLGRLLVGLMRVAHYTRTATPLIDETWHSQTLLLSAQLRLSRSITVLSHDEIATPLAWGFFRPVILLPAVAESWSARRKRLVLAHEFSHIKGHDWLVQTLVQLACAVYWFNPLVWIAARRLFVERERACDSDVIAAGAKPSEYATHLIDIAKSMHLHGTAPSAVPAMVRPSQLRVRIISILDHNKRIRRGMALTMPMVLSMTTLVISLGTVRLWDDHRVSGDAQDVLHTPESITTPDDSNSAAHNEPSGSLHGNQSSLAIDAINSALRDEAPMVRRMAVWAYALSAPDDIPRPERDSLVDSKQQPCEAPDAGENAAVEFGASPELIRGLNELGYSDLSLDQVTRASAFAVTPELIRGLNELGYSDLSLDQLMRAGHFGVTPELIRGLGELGYTDLSLNQVMQAGSLGATPELIRGLAELGYTDLSLEEAMQAGSLGATPELIRGLAELGYTDLSLEEAMQAGSLGATPELIRGLSEDGYTDLSQDQLIDFRSCGIDREYIRKANEEGNRDLTPDELIKRRVEELAPPEGKEHNDGRSGTRWDKDRGSLPPDPHRAATRVAQRVTDRALRRSTNRAHQRAANRVHRRVGDRIWRRAGIHSDDSIACQIDGVIAESIDRSIAKSID